MPTLKINGKEVTVEAGATILQACEQAGFEIPRFCYHERLSIAGNCRMCLVEMERSPKPIASCAMPAAEGMAIYTDTPGVKKAREGVMEFLLINHPLDCPICDQGGECDLQDQALFYGRGKTRYQENKRAVEEKHMGPLVKTVMTRCIHCTRCIRFATEVAGVEDIGALGRGEHMEVTTYLEKTIDSELSGNVIDLCPVGALTSKPYAFTARSWELKKTESIDVMDALGCAIRVDSRGNEVMRVLPRLNEEVNEEWISDKTRFACDGLKYRRLDRPYVRRRGKLQEATWAQAFEAIAKKLKRTKPKEIAGIIGDLSDLEAMKALKDLLAGLGSKRLEGRSDGAALDPANRSGFLFNSTIAGLEQADYVLLVGTNPREEAPVLNARIGRLARAGALGVGRIGALEDLTYKVEDFGDDPRVLEQILTGKHAAARALKKAKKPLLIVGMGALCRKDGAVILYAARAIAEKFKMNRMDWNGFNVLHSAASRAGALALGLAARGGMEAITRDAKAGKLKVVFLHGADEVDLEALGKAYLIYIGHHGDRGAEGADVILPGAAYTEKDGTYINTEGRIQQGFRAIFPPGDAREDWTILRALSEVLGCTLPYDDLAGLRRALGEDIPEIAAGEAMLRSQWGKFGKEGKIAALKLKPSQANFYFTNAIARASVTMADCSEARGFSTSTKKRTGTDD
ncbi:MAG: NADH-quinone oxidoreductase subunit G [Proteobacteria bacterium]|nr:NADH-quinone oxidoreductase subunit G [Pseudomonadota bacterium]